MSAGAYRCGHPRSPENNMHSGAITHCLTCHHNRLEIKAQARRERDQDILTMYLNGETVAVIARVHRLSRERVERLLIDSGIKTKRPFADDPLYPDRSLNVAAELAGATVKQLVSEWRAPKILVHARWAIMMAWRERDASTTQIGRRLNRDHSTVCYGLQMGKFQSERNEEFRGLLDRIRAA